MTTQLFPLRGSLDGLCAEGKAPASRSLDSEIRKAEEHLASVSASRLSLRLAPS